MSLDQLEHFTCIFDFYHIIVGSLLCRLVVIVLAVSTNKVMVAVCLASFIDNVICDDSVEICLDPVDVRRDWFMYDRQKQILENVVCHGLLLDVERNHGADFIAIRFKDVLSLSYSFFGFYFIFHVEHSAFTSVARLSLSRPEKP